MGFSNYSVVIFAYSRVGLLKQTIESVLNATKSSEWKKILVVQEGFPEVMDLAITFKSSFDLLIFTKPRHETTLGNINENRILGTSIGFDYFQSDFVLGIEEDTKIAKDSLVFIEEIYNRYRLRKAFRGINLGSIEPQSENTQASYSLLRYGLHGQAGVITQKTWKKLDLARLRRDIETEGWDSVFEFTLKSGFMVTPNSSRSLDRGWSGTHSPADANHPHYLGMAKSWTPEYSGHPSSYTHQNLPHTWRKDAVIYRKIDSLAYFLIATKLGRKLYNRTFGR